MGIREVENWAEVTAKRRDQATSITLPAYDAGGEEEHDPWFDPHLPAHPKVDVATLKAELAKLIRRGLPATPKTAGDVLPNLRSVIARSVHPYDPVSRIASLTQLLVRVLVEYEDRGEAARILFGVAKGTRGTTLTGRRQKAADVLAYDVTHFRKQIEPEILETVATVLYEDLLRYKRRIRRAPLAEEPTGDTPQITERDFTHQEELISRIWARVYDWRAELIAAGRLEGQPGYDSQAEDHRKAAVRQEQLLRRLIDEYGSTYGDRLIQHGEAEWNADALIRLRS